MFLLIFFPHPSESGLGLGLAQVQNRLFGLGFISGETGIGKSTLMDTLFNTNFDSTQSSHDLPGVKLKAHTYGIFSFFSLCTV